MKTFVLTSLLLALASCGSTGKIERYTIASQQADCTGVGLQKCLIVKRGTVSDWTFFYSKINGFEYTPGFEYVIDVKEEPIENVPADASAIKYTMVKLISKEQKESENLPIKIKQNKFECVGKVLEVSTEDIGRGGAAGKVEVKVVKLQVTSSTNDEIKSGDVIYAELIANTKAKPVVGREYVFKAQNMHPAHAKGKYLLQTDVLDLVS